MLNYEQLDGLKNLLNELFRKREILANLKKVQADIFSKAKAKVPKSVTITSVDENINYSLDFNDLKAIVEVREEEIKNLENDLKKYGVEVEH